MQNTVLRRLRGFTLVELMVVVAIIGMLAAAVTVSVMGQSYDARVTRVKSDMDSIKKALKLYKLAVGRYPRELSGLWEQPSEARKWKGPYLEEYPPLDPWGNEYQYSYRGGNDFEIISYGADGGSGGADEDEDLSSKTINER